MRLRSLVLALPVALLVLPAAAQTTDNADDAVRDPDFAGRVFDSPVPVPKTDTSADDAAPAFPVVPPEAATDTEPTGTETTATEPRVTAPSVTGPAATEPRMSVPTATDPAGSDAARDDTANGGDGSTIETRPLPVVLRPGEPPSTALDAGGRIKSAPDPNTEPGERTDQRFVRAPAGSTEPDAEPTLGVPIASPETDLRRGAKLRQLDKMTGGIVTYDIAVGETKDVARLRVKLDACRSPGDNDSHGTMAHLQIWDTKTSEKDPAAPPAFAGWMFAESPALSALDHPRYDLWVISCTTVAGETSAGSE